MFLEQRKRGQVIKDGEWIVTIQLTQDGLDAGPPITLRYGDAYLAAEPRNVGYLIASAMNERAKALKPGRKRK